MHTRFTRLALVFGAVAALALSLACIGRRAPAGPVQGWWSQLGPVLPHESFPSDCRLCHTGTDWHTLVEDFEFDHLEATGHALAGAHAEARCLRCHNDRGPVELYASRGCAGCHDDVHRRQLGSDCADCHGETDWRARAALERHARTRFPLLGSHAAAPCYACHIGAEVGQFTRADPDCANCHAADLAAAVDPDHMAMGFVRSCERCHVPTRWDGAGFAHPGFPLGGAHGGLSCNDCHSLPASLASFTCIDCHEHSRSEMADEHDDVSAYAYRSSACFACHPDGRE